MPERRTESEIDESLQEVGYLIMETDVIPGGPQILKGLPRKYRSIFIGIESESLKAEHLVYDPLFLVVVQARLGSDEVNPDNLLKTMEKLSYTHVPTPDKMMVIGVKRRQPTAWELYERRPQ